VGINNIPGLMPIEVVEVFVLLGPYSFVLLVLIPFPNASMVVLSIYPEVFPLLIPALIPPLK
jgi:hypothetical protein